MKHSHLHPTDNEHLSRTCTNVLGKLSSKEFFIVTHDTIAARELLVPVQHSHSGRPQASTSPSQRNHLSSRIKIARLLAENSPISENLRLRVISNAACTTPDACSSTQLSSSDAGGTNRIPSRHTATASGCWPERCAGAKQANTKTEGNECAAVMNIITLGLGVFCVAVRRRPKQGPRPTVLSPERPKPSMYFLLQNQDRTFCCKIKTKTSRYQCCSKTKTKTNLSWSYNMLRG